MLVFIACDSSVNQVKDEPESKTNSDSSFVHIVFFDLVDSLDDQSVSQFISTLKELSEIEQVSGFFAGPYLEMGDKRALNQYDICMQMRFNSRKEYTLYQAHPSHLALKKNVIHFLKSSPRTYDYTIN